MIEVFQCTLDPRLAPARVLVRHADGQATNLRLDTWSSEPPTRISPLPRDQLAMPPENGVRRDDRGHLCEQPTTEALTDGGETPSFVIA
jgi:hypothetical protein